MIEIEFLRSLGLDEDTASALAEMIAEETALEATSIADRLLQERAGKLPRLLSCTPGGAGSEIGVEEFAKMGYSERARLHANNPQLYRELTNSR